MADEAEEGVVRAAEVKKSPVAVPRRRKLVGKKTKKTLSVGSTSEEESKSEGEKPRRRPSATTSDEETDPRADLRKLSEKRKKAQAKREEEEAARAKKEEEELEQWTRILTEAKAKKDPWWKLWKWRPDFSWPDFSRREPPKPPEETPPEKPPETRRALRDFSRDAAVVFREFKVVSRPQLDQIRVLRNKCVGELILVIFFCGLGAFMFRFTESAFENFYKCGVKRVKRDFVEELWKGSQYMREQEWKSKARRKLMEFEEQLAAAFDAGISSYSGHRSWSFINALLYALTVITTIGYGHIAPATTTGKALTIVYAIIGIPMFLILLADFGKLFTRGIKWIWAFVRRLYYTGSCKKVRKTAPVQEVMKGVQLVYDIAAFRRPSQVPPGTEQPATDQDTTVPPTPAPSNFVIDDEFNLPISVAITILVAYIFCGAVVFYVWEEWSFFESFYFVFISMSTIGFGDLVPQNKMYMMASIVYLAFGLALTSMCINVVQEKLSDTFRQASAKIGATIGLKVQNKEDGTMTPASATQVEIAQVHETNHTPPLNQPTAL